MNRIFCGSSEDMHHVADASVHLVITSPPYNVAMGYDAHSDDLPLDDYLSLLGRVFTECQRVLVDGGRLCVNVANTGRKPYIPLTMHVTRLVLDLGFLHRGEIIWDKGASGLSTAWGSWKSPANPTLRDRHEYVLVFSKNTYQRESTAKLSTPINDWAMLTQSVWQLQPASALQTGHPAPFPVELPRRLILLYSYIDDVVLDPFIGSGTTALAAKRTGREYIGYDISAKYVTLAADRLRQEYLLNTDPVYLAPH